MALPGASSGLPRANASAACWQLYGEVQGFEASHLAQLGRFHQLTVDAYASQHAGGAARPIGPAFGLIGLHLALDRGFTGDQVRAVHQHLASPRTDWPAFTPPEGHAALTVFDVAAVASVDGHAEMVQRWAAAVWDFWRPVHPRVVALLEERLSTAGLARIVGDA